MIVTIKSSAEGTQILTEDGRDLASAVYSASWSIESNDFARAELRLGLVEIEAVAEARMIGPGGKEVRRIEYADGTVDEYPAT